jgi:hypothetical protein
LIISRELDIQTGFCVLFYQLTADLRMMVQNLSPEFVDSENSSYSARKESELSDFFCFVVFSRLASFSPQNFRESPRKCVKKLNPRSSNSTLTHFIPLPLCTTPQKGF